LIEEDEVTARSDVRKSVEPMLPQIEIGIAKARVEYGEAIDERDFTWRKVHPEEVPAGAVTKEKLAEVVGLFASELIPAGHPMVFRLLSKEVNDDFEIPLEHVASTIMVDETSGVGRHVRPNDREDVLFSKRDGQELSVKTLIHFVKVLSVDGARRVQEDVPGRRGAFPVTLLVTKRDS